MKRKILHGADIEVSCLGLGTVKFGRNEQVKYPTSFDLPDDEAILKLFRQMQLSARIWNVIGMPIIVWFTHDVVRMVSEAQGS